MSRLFSWLFGSPLLIVLVASFLLVAALMGGLSMLVTARVIDDYLAVDEAEHVARDMELAEAFYRLRQDKIAAMGHRLAQDPQVLQSLPAALGGQPEALRTIDQQIVYELTVPPLTGSHLLAVLDAQGNMLAGRTLSLSDGRLSSITFRESWGELPVVQDALSSGRDQAATEVVPAEFLVPVGLGQQARTKLIDIPQAAPHPFDPRAGTGGLALTAVYPMRREDGGVHGAVLVLYLLNNDHSLVDEIKDVAGVETVTIFLGDLRVATNVPMEDGRRAVGTRMAQNVYDQVLEQNRDFVGRAYVVTDWFITHYKPLRDHRDQTVGVLYVGTRESAFLRLVNIFHRQVLRIALVCLVLTGVIAIPVAQIITGPITNLVEANRRLAQGDMTVRVQVHGSGELALLERSFNSMVETLQRTGTELLHKERLAAMGQLAAGVAHEINNPLGTILLFADLMYKDAAEQDPRRQDLKMILQETSRCKNIVANLLNFARQHEVLAQETDLHALLDQVVVSVSCQPIFQGIEIVRKYGVDLPTVQADPVQLQQVFTNLMNNAAEAMKGTGTLTLATRRSNHKWAEIMVTDTGCGIPEESLGKLFTPFYTTKPPGKGTGLGLSIVYGIVKTHRGQVTVESKVGQGSSFTVALPISLPEEGAERKPSPVGVFA